MSNTTAQDLSPFEQAEVNAVRFGSSLILAQRALELIKASDTFKAVRNDRSLSNEQRAAYLAGERGVNVALADFADNLESILGVSL